MEGRKTIFPGKVTVFMLFTPSNKQYYCINNGKYFVIYKIKLTNPIYEV